MTGGAAEARNAGRGFTLTTRWAAIVLAVLVTAFFHEVMLEGRTFVSPDATQPAGFVRAGEQALWQEHTYPLWNPLVFTGMPSFGSGAYNPLIYPPDWPLGLVQKVVPLPDQTWLILYYFLGGLFMFLLAREWGAGAEGALIGAAAFVFAPNLVAVGAHGHGSQLVDSAYAPLMLWLASRWMRRGAPRDLAWLALAGGFQLLRGHVQICFYTWLAVGLYALVEAAMQLRRPSPDGADAAGVPTPAPLTPVVRLAGLALGAALAFGVSAFYTLPLHDYARHSMRSGGAGGGIGIENATAWSLAPYELPEIVIPGWVGFGGGTYWGGMPFTDYPNAYLGIVAILLLLPALLAWPGVASAPRPGAIAPAARTGSQAAPRIFAALLALLALLVAFGNHFPLYRVLYEHLPLFNKFRIPVMIVLLLQVAVALGAAWGWSAVVAVGDRKGSRSARLSRVLLGAGAALAAVLLVGIVGRELWQAQYIKSAIAIKGGSMRFGSQVYGATQAGMAWTECYGSFVRAAIIGLVALGIAWLARAGRFRVPATAALLALLLFELWPVSARVMAPVIGARETQAQDAGRDDTIEFLEKAGPAGSFRIVPFDDYQSNRFATFGIASLGGYHAAKPQLFQTFADHRLIDNLSWLRLLNVRYVVVTSPYQSVPGFLKVVHEGANQVLEFLPALPRVTVIGRFQVLSPPTAILDSIAGGHFDGASMTFLEQDPGLTLGPVAGAHATIDSYRLNDVALTVDTPGPALVRLADLWYPDWVATVDGRPVEILRADYMLRAVAVPAGRHRVEFHFRSQAVRIGLILTFVSLGLVLAGLGATTLGRRTRTAAVPAPGGGA